MGREIYSYELKQEVVKYVLEEGHTHKEAAEHFGVTLYPVEKWVNLYQCHGDKGLESRNRWNRAQTFTGEFKLNVLKYMEENHLSYTKTAACFCIDVVTVSKWARQYRERGTEALFRKKKPMKKKKSNKQAELSLQEIKRLQEENRRLQMEVDYLKKLNALAREKERSAKRNG